MRPSDRSRPETGLAAGAADLPSRPADPAGRRQCVADLPAAADLPDAADRLASRLARLPDAHPAAWSPVGPAVAGNRRPASADAWWQGESETWWRGEGETWWRGQPQAEDDSGAGVGGEPGTDGVGGEPGADETDGEGGSDGEGDGGGPAETDGPAGPGDNPDAETGDTGGRAASRPAAVRGRPGRRGTGPAGPGHSPRDGRWAEEALSRAVSAQGGYRPWFSTGGAGDPWFASQR